MTHLLKFIINIHDIKNNFLEETSINCKRFKLISGNFRKLIDIIIIKDIMIHNHMT